MIGIGKNLHVRATKPGVSVVDVPAWRSGRYALSLIIAAGPNAWTTDALDQNLATSVQAFYPPLNPVTKAYALPHAIVLLAGTIGTPNANTTLLPALTAVDQLGANLAEVQAAITSRFTQYRYTNWERNLVGKSALATSGYTATTLFGTVIRDILHHIEHSTLRPRPVSPPEPHNTEYLDNFAVDSSADWTEDGASPYIRDAVNSELDQTTWDNDARLRYSANAPGGLAHESQATSLTNATNRVVGPAQRMYGTGDDAYGTYWNTANLIVCRFNAAVRTDIANHSPSVTAGHALTVRQATEGANGANVVINTWYATAAVKPAVDPGWIGVDASPDFTFTDTAANRLDDDTQHLQGGFAGRGPSAAGFDTRTDYWKVRAIADRGAGAAATWGQRLAMRRNRLVRTA